MSCNCNETSICTKKKNLPSKDTIVNGDKVPVLDPNGKCYLKPLSADGCCYYEVTLVELQDLIADEQLITGGLYKISGVHKNKDRLSLYDDGGNNGTTIFLRAISESELEKSGWGYFFNPNYDKGGYGTVDASLSGYYLYNIWDGNNPEWQPTYDVGRKVIWGGYVWTKYF